MIDWFELIVGILELCLGIYLTKTSNEGRYIFFLLAGHHITKGLKGLEDK